MSRGSDAYLVSPWAETCCLGRFSRSVRRIKSHRVKLADDPLTIPWALLGGPAATHLPAGLKAPKPPSREQHNRSSLSHCGVGGASARPGLLL